MKPMKLKSSRKKTYSRIREWRSARRPRILFTKSEASPERTIIIRLGIVLLLIAFVLTVFWFDRYGLRDAADPYR